MSSDLISKNDGSSFIGGIKSWQNLGVNSVLANDVKVNNEIECDELKVANDISCVDLNASGVVSAAELKITNYIGDSSTFYQSGAWNAAIFDLSGNPFTTTNNKSQFYRIGKYVTAQFYLEWTSKGAASGTILFTLPFTSAAGITNPATVGDCLGVNYTSGNQLVIFNYATEGSAVCGSLVAGGSVSLLLSGNFSNSGKLNFTITYRIN